MNDRWYLVEKFEGALNQYQVQDRITKTEFESVYKEIKEYGRSGQIKSVSSYIDEADSGNRQILSYSTAERSSVNSDEFGYGRQDNRVYPMGEIEAERREQSERNGNGDSKSSRENRETVTTDKIKKSSEKIKHTCTVHLTYGKVDCYQY